MGLVLSNLSTKLFVIAILSVLYLGWSASQQSLWTAEHGLGYGMAIVGGSLILLQLLYPLRKRTGLLGKSIPVKYWFRMHMIFGVCGPVLVVLHSNFSLASINSRVAMFSMLLVASSGLIGRYIYSRIHRGLYGKKEGVGSLMTQCKILEAQMDAMFAHSAFTQSAEFNADFIALKTEVLKGARSVVNSVLRWLRFRFMMRAFYSKLERKGIMGFSELKNQGLLTRKHYQKDKRQLKKLIRSHKKNMIKVLELQFYERLFSLWHILHLPLFMLLIAAGLTHVYAVHVY